MEEKERTPDVLTGKMSRRELFVKTAKAAIPTLGILGLTLTGLTGTAKAMDLRGCSAACQGYCMRGCAESCVGAGCQGTCAGGCAGGCGGSCKGSCDASCTQGCRNISLRG